MFLYDPTPVDQGPIRDKPPCKDCTERSPGCHDRCEGYAEWRAKLEAVKAARRQYDRRREDDIQKWRNVF